MFVSWTGAQHNFLCGVWCTKTFAENIQHLQRNKSASDEATKKIIWVLPCLALFLLPFCILTTRESQAHQKKTTANDAWLFADCDWLIFHKRRRKKRVQNNNNAFFPKNIFVSGWLTRGCVAYNIYISGLDFLFGYLAVWKFLDMTS